MRRHTKFEVGGEVYVASSARALVAQLNSSSFSPCDTDEEFMAEVADRTTMQDGAKPRFGSCEDFVEDLVKDGLIKVLVECD